MAIVVSRLDKMNVVFAKTQCIARYVANYIFYIYVLMYMYNIH